MASIDILAGLRGRQYGTVRLEITGLQVSNDTRDAVLAVAVAVAEQMADNWIAGKTPDGTGRMPAPTAEALRHRARRGGGGSGIYGVSSGRLARSLAAHRTARGAEIRAAEKAPGQLARALGGVPLRPDLSAVNVRNAIRRALRSLVT